MSLQRPLFRLDSGEGPFRSRAFERALLDLLDAVDRCECPIVLAGAPGVGKSVLLATAARELAGKGLKVASFISPASVGTGLTAWVVLVDDADTAQPARLREIADAAKRRGASAIFAAIGDHIASGAARTVRLAPMSGQEMQDFLLDAASKAGRPDLFSPAAQDAIVEAVFGIPRTAKMIANGAVMEALFEGSRVVESRHVAAAIAARQPLPPAEDDYRLEPPELAVVAAASAVPAQILIEDETDEVDAQPMRPFKVDALPGFRLDARGAAVGGTALALLIAATGVMAGRVDISRVAGWFRSQISAENNSAPLTEVSAAGPPAATPLALLSDPAAAEPIAEPPALTAESISDALPDVAAIAPQPSLPDPTTPGYRPPTPPLPTVEAARRAGITVVGANVATTARRQRPGASEARPEPTRQADTIAVAEIAPVDVNVTLKD